MLYVRNASTNPYFNLAMEEYVMKHFDEDLFMLWRNAPSIIVGRNQNTLQEVNYDYVKARHIPVVRRMSGGGAVFHDLGNINFTFVQSGESGFSDYAKFTRPIIDYLKTLGIEAYLQGRNDLMIDGKKISGNAQYMEKGRTLHHGTLLFDANMTDISEALRVNPLKIQSKGVKSVAKRVGNISAYLSAPMDVQTFMKGLEDYVAALGGDIRVVDLDQGQLAQVNQLVKEKYETWEWNFGYSPRYSFNKEGYYESGMIEAHLDVSSGGIIEKVRINGDFFGMADIGVIEQALIGVRHEYEAMANVLETFDIPRYCAGMDAKRLAKALI